MSHEPSGAESVSGRARTILFVCTANICRSPLAEGLLRSEIADLGLTIRSAGTHALVGHPPIAESIDYLRRRAGAVLEHRGTALTVPTIRDSGIVLTMTERQRAEVVRMDPGALRRMFTLRQFVRLVPHLPSQGAFRGVDELAETVARFRAVAGPTGRGEDDIVDPYGGPPERFEHSFALIARASGQLAATLRARLACPDAETTPQ